MEEKVKVEINKIFQEFEICKIDFDRKIKIFDYENNSEINIPINEYLWFFAQSVKNEKNLFTMNFPDYIYHELAEKGNVEFKNSTIGYGIVGFYEDENDIIGTYVKFGNRSYGPVLKNNKYTKQIINFCETILDKLFVDNYKIYPIFLNVTLNDKHSHSVVLICGREGTGLKLFMYDPAGCESIYQEETECFLYDIFLIMLDKNKNSSYFPQEIKNNNYDDPFSKNNITIIKNKPEIFLLAIQTMTDPSIKYGYCFVYSSFFLYCLLRNSTSNPEINFEELVVQTQYNLIRIILEKNKEYFYKTIVCFINMMKERFFIVNNGKNYEKLNNRILELYYSYSDINERNINTINESLENSLNFTQYTESRNYDEELNLLDWSNIKKLRENEECKENHQCISKICVDNRCTRPTPNDKLDFLTRLEWEEY